MLRSSATEIRNVKYFQVIVSISKTLMKNKPDAEQSIRKGLSDIGGFSLPESFLEGI